MTHSPPPSTIEALHHDLVQEFRHTNTQVAEIKALAKETNGRVTRLEMWRAATIGAGALVGFLFAGLSVWLTIVQRAS